MLLERGRAFLSSRKMARVGAVALVLAGFAGLAASAVLIIMPVLQAMGVLAEPPLYDDQGYYYDDEHGYILSVSHDIAMFSDYLLKWVLIPVGVLGMCALLPRERRRLRKVVLLGSTAALALAFLACLAVLASWNSSTGPPLWMYFAFVIGTPVGVALLFGVAGSRVRGLGRWRFAMPLIGLMSTPLAGLLFSLAYLTAPPAMSDAAELLLYGPGTLASAGMVFSGFLLFGAKQREERLLAGERKALETKNLALARRLYEQAWVAGDLAVVEELVAEDVSDLVHHRRGREEFKRSICNMRRTFPDLRVTIESQIVDGEEVTTRCELSGTDRGGVLWYPATNRSAVFTATYRDSFSDGKLVERRGEVAMRSLLERLGLPSAGA